MATPETHGGLGAVCPTCGGTAVRPVSEARYAKGSMRKDLTTRLAKGPEKGGDGCLHFLEGMVLTGIGVALAWTGHQQDKPLYLFGGIALAVLCFAGTLGVVRSDRRERAAEKAGDQRASRVWEPAPLLRRLRNGLLPRRGAVGGHHDARGLPAVRVDGGRLRGPAAHPLAGAVTPRGLPVPPGCGRTVFRGPP
ncbi:hypothetical protein ACWV95_12035 [Streptomyces albus]